jgi:hypothetical protein
MKQNWPDWDVYERDCCTCVYCGFSGINNFNAWRQLAIDHLIPTCRGGTNNHDNKVVACHRCNTLKGSYDPSDGWGSLPVPKDLKDQLILKVKTFLNIDGSEERKDFDLMMGELRAEGRC